MATLIERMRAAREKWVDVGPFDLLIRRPTRFQVATWNAGKETDALRHCIVNWRRVSELSLGLPGGDSREIPFDVDTCIEFLEDHPDEMAAVFNAISAAVLEHADAADAAGKK